MKVLSAITGSIAGLTLFGLVVLAGTTLGLPGGPGWLILGVPFVMWMGYLAVIEK